MLQVFILNMSFTTPSAASFFGNRGEREALAQSAVELKTK